MKTAIALRHVHFEDLGTLHPLLVDRGFAVRTLDATIDDLSAPDLDAAGLLVVLGGPIGAHDEDAYPFLSAELALIERRLASGRPVLGVCLGAQLIARALGGRVGPMGHKEIGFGALDLTEQGRASALRSLAGVSVLHWHGDRIELPASATLLASTSKCAEQAFSVGPSVLGLQFHLEADADRIEQWLVGHASELAQVGIDPRSLRQDARRHGAALAAAARRTIGEWLTCLDA